MHELQDVVGVSTTSFAHQLPDDVVGVGTTSFAHQLPDDVYLLPGCNLFHHKVNKGRFDGSIRIIRRVVGLDQRGWGIMLVGLSDVPQVFIAGGIGPPFAKEEASMPPLSSMEGGASFRTPPGTGPGGEP